MDPFVGGVVFFKLLDGTIEDIHQIGLFYLSQIGTKDEQRPIGTYWQDYDKLGLTRNNQLEWVDIFRD